VFVSAFTTLYCVINVSVSMFSWTQLIKIIIILCADVFYGREVGRLKAELHSTVPLPINNNWRNVFVCLIFESSWLLRIYVKSPMKQRCTALVLGNSVSVSTEAVCCYCNRVDSELPSAKLSGFNCDNFSNTSATKEFRKTKLIKYLIRKCYFSEAALVKT